MLSTIDATRQRVPMHGISEQLLDAQAIAAGLPLLKVPIPFPCPNEEYEAAMLRAIEALLEQGVTHIAFGDLFLEEIRAYREKNMAGTGIEPVFPVWGLDTGVLAEEMIDSGLRARVSAVDASVLSDDFAGRLFDRQFLEDLPGTADPCGEHGEFHTYVFAGPIYDHKIPVRSTAVETSDGLTTALLELQEPR